MTRPAALNRVNKRLRRGTNSEKQARNALWLTRPEGVRRNVWDLWDLWDSRPCGCGNQCLWCHYNNPFITEPAQKYKKGAVILRRPVHSFVHSFVHLFVHSFRAIFCKHLPGAFDSICYILFFIIPYWGIAPPQPGLRLYQTWIVNLQFTPE